MSSSEMTHTLDSLRPKPRLQNGLLTWIRRVLLKLLVALLCLAGIGAAYQAIATVRDAGTYPPPGRLVDVGGYKLHIYCTGPANTGNPTVILEGGLGATTSTWAWVQPAVAQTTLVCAYDRAGMGWSDPSTGAQDAQQIAGALHTLLTNSGLAGPYVLVGWSFGGLYARVFADHYPDEVGGMVLIDSSHPDQMHQHTSGRGAMQDHDSHLRRCAPFGPPWRDADHGALAAAFGFAVTAK